MQKKKCTNCEKEFNSKELKKINKNFLCKDCYRINREKFRKKCIQEDNCEEEIKELKLKENKEWVEKNRVKIRERARLRYKRLNPSAVTYRKGTEKVLKVNGSKEKKESIALALTKEDKQLLFKKYIKQGLSYEECIKKIDEINESLKDLGRRLRANLKIKQEDKDKIFKEEFAKICYY